MDEQGSELRWGVERRLEFIEFRLYWEGGINRSDITQQFGVSVPQASKDLSQYQELAVGNVEYDKSHRRYVVTDKFSPRFLKPDPDQYLSQLRAIADRALRPNQTWLSTLPTTDGLPVLHRNIDPELLRKVLFAIRKKQSIEIFYQSMNRDRTKPIWRGISPHAFANDGERWHVRAYCHKREAFRDFLLSRCLDSRAMRAPYYSDREDKDWVEFFDVILVANPKMSEFQKRVIGMDYQMPEGSIKVPIRRALLFYFAKQYLETDQTQHAPLVIQNRKEFDTVVQSVGS